MKGAGGKTARLINVERLGREPMNFDIQVTEAECEAIVTSLDILALSGVKASGSLVRQGKNGQVVVTGRLRATAVQACVVSLDPVEQAIDEEFTVFYTFDPEDLEIEDLDKVVGLEEPDPPELIVGGRIDLLAMVSEQVALALEPYPRRAGLPEPVEEEDLDMDQVKKEQGTHQPFANLKDLMSKK
ncbi:DUF177 domain-containing protein [Sneathiella sp.]|uniref:YceD family protein n=1 Tax=Sneathiella sp. TaxID=1964365 RepID=UPI00261AB5DF|nr:DUF177 domain-containing protein [Sneathiella sp.]MDF2366465.1 DUF177 domain-containing protein [Sneathiella sp.]